MSTTNINNISNLTVLSWNARGVGSHTSNHKMYELQNYVNNNEVHVVCLQETNFKSKNKQVQLKGYQDPVRSKERDKASGTGVAIYVKLGIPFTEISIDQDCPIESCAITLHLTKHLYFRIQCVYAQPADNTIKNYSKIFHSLEHRNNNIIVGDFNLKHPCWNPEGDPRCDDHAENLLKFMNNNSLNFLNDGQVTRLSDRADHLDSAIDLALASANLQAISDFNVIDNSFGSDHLPIVINLKLKIEHTLPSMQHKWKINKASPEQWNNFKAQCDNEFIPNQDPTDSNTHFRSYLTKLKTALDNSIPVANKKPKKIKRSVPWWNQDCEAAIKYREKCRRKWNKIKTGPKYEKLKEARATVKQVIKKAKLDSWNDFCNNLSYKTTSKELWDQVHRMQGRPPPITPIFRINGEILVTNADKATALVHHYQAVSSDEGYTQEFIERKLKIKEEFPAWLETHKQDENHNYNAPFSLFELETALLTCKNGAPGDDNIHYKILKQLPLSAKQDLLALYNKSWTEGTLPEEWHEATIIPILKRNKPKDDPASYRPISLTSTFTKLMQKMIKPRLCAFLEKNNLISNNQSGCRAHHSCEDHIVRLEADIRRAQNLGQSVAAVFLDLTAAFDKLWNENAIQMLNKLGIQGTMLKWLAAFLTTRKIKVRLQDATSETVDTINGCPQGSVLSPILFSATMNTLDRAINEHNAKHEIDLINLSLFVDDSAIWTTSKLPKIAISKIQKALTTIETWSSTYGFIINPTKTQAIVFSNGTSKATSKKIADLPQLTLCGTPLPYLEKITFLGMIFDKYLTWKDHILNLLVRCQKDLNFIKCIQKNNWGTDKQALMRIYKATIWAKINYGSIAYHSANNTLLYKLQVIQNTALKIITGTRKSTSTVLLHIECGMLTLNHQRDINQLKYHARTKALGDDLPINLSVTKDDPAYLKANKKNPYAMNVQTLNEYYEIDNIKVQPPTYYSLSEISKPNIDFHLSTLIKKSEIDSNSAAVALDYINTTYGEHTHIYTDGSKNEELELAGAAYVVYNPQNVIIHHGRVKHQKELSIFTCELSIINDAIIWLNTLDTHGQTNYAILTDSLSSLQALSAGTSKTRPDLVYAVLEGITQLTNKNIALKLIWIPSHVGIPGNDYADKLAKIGSQEGLLSGLKPSARELIAIIKQKAYNEQDHHCSKYCVDKDLPLITNPNHKIHIYSPIKTEDRAYTRMRLMVTRLHGDYYKPVLCPKCNTPDTFEHLFFICPEHSIQRLELSAGVLTAYKNNTIISRNHLLMPPSEIGPIVRQHVFKFLRDTGYLNKI